MVMKQVSEGFLVNSKGLGKVKWVFWKERGSFVFIWKVEGFGARIPGREGFFCNNYTADRYLQLTAVGSGSDGPDLSWNLDRPFTIGHSGPDLESGSPDYDRTFRTRSGIWDRGVSGWAHRGTWRLRTSTRVGNRVLARGPQPSGGAFYL